jgi:hypothetical protein
MEKWLWFCIELSGQTWIYGSLRCGFCILKMDQTLYLVKWSAPHRTCQRPVERVRTHQQHVYARRERIRARQKCIHARERVVRAGWKTQTMAGRPRPPPMCSRTEIPIHAHGYPSAPMGTHSCPQVRARACIEPV